MVAATLWGCGGTPGAIEVPRSVGAAGPHRPKWVAEVGHVLEDVRQCVAAHGAGADVLLVRTSENEEELELETWIVTLNPGSVQGQVCVVREGRVVFLEEVAVPFEDREGLPLFRLGAEPPAHPSAIEVFDGRGVGEAIGWLYWPEGGGGAKE